MYPVINEEFCKGCNLCIEVCPKRVFEKSGRISHRGYIVADVKYKDRCTNFNLKGNSKPLCEICWLTCPEHAIEFKGD